MSYDVGLYINTGLFETEVIDCGNYTYNVSGMYYAVMPEGLKTIEGMIASEAVPILKSAIDEMILQKDELKKLEPSNGWGSFEGAVKFLDSILSGCLDHPTTKIRIT